MEKVSIKKNIILNTIYQVLLIITPFITTPYIARVIGAEGVGIYSYTKSIVFYFTHFVTLGTISYGKRQISRNRDDVKKRSALFWEIELLTVITGIISLIGWGILIGIAKEYKVYYIILTMNIINAILNISWLYIGLEQLKYTIVKNIIFKIIGVVLLFVFVKSSNDLAKYIGIMSLSSLLVKIEKLKILRHFKETLIYFIPTIAASIYTVLDKILIGKMTGSTLENGYYEQATKLIDMAIVITFKSLNLVLSSRIAYLFVKEKYAEIHKKIDDSVNYILFMGIGIMFGLWGISNKFVPLFFGEGYNKVITLIILQAPLIIIIGLSNCLGSLYYNPAGLRIKSAKFIIMGSVINLILNLILIPKFWGIGALVASICAELIVTAMYLKHCNGYLTIKKIIYFSWKKLIAGSIMCIIILLEQLASINDLILLCIQIISGFSIYIICLTVLKDVFITEILKKHVIDRIRIKIK